MFSYGFFCVTYCRTAGNFLFTVPCVSFRLIRNTGFWPVSFWRGDLRRRTEISQPPDYRTYSPEVTSLRSNLPVHRSVCAQKGFHHADLIIISDIQRNVKTFFSVFHSFFEIFLAVRGCTRQRGKCPPPGHFPLRYLIPDQAASAYYNGVSIRYKEHRDAMHPGVPYYICPQIPSLAFSAEIIS